MKLSCAPLWKLQVIVKTYKEKNVNENIIERQTSVTETQGLVLGNDKFKKNKFQTFFVPNRNAWLCRKIGNLPFLHRSCKTFPSRTPQLLLLKGKGYFPKWKLHNCMPFPKSVLVATLDTHCSLWRLRRPNHLTIGKLPLQKIA